MKKIQPSSVTIEEAIARLVNMDYIPTGFSLNEMSAAFLEEAEVAYHNAKLDKLPPEALMLFAIRVDICRAKYDLAMSLFEHVKLELEHPKTSLLKKSSDSVSDIRLELKSVGNWAENNFGISLPDWSGNVLVEAHPNEQFEWKDVTIKIYKDYKIGFFIGDRLDKKLTFEETGLMRKDKNKPNKSGGILIGLSQGMKFPEASRPENKDKTAISKLRNALKKLTNISKEPFYAINENEGWRPKFKLVDDRDNADLRAKKRAVKVNYDDNRQYTEANSEHEAGEDDVRPFEDEGDETSEWIKNNGKSYQ